ncbi:MAG: tetratricopeptide repeat protein, partial [Candidatus Binataceae bacterium]
QDWANAARALSDLVPDADAGTLKDADARLVLDWATALTLAGDERTLVRVRQKYTGPMSNTPYKDAFALITTPRERGAMDAQAVRQQIQQAEQFKTFMVEYKDMIGQNPLSKIN